MSNLASHLEYSGATAKLSGIKWDLHGCQAEEHCGVKCLQHWACHTVAEHVLFSKSLPGCMGDVLCLDDKMAKPSAVSMSDGM